MSFYSVISVSVLTAPDTESVFSFDHLIDGLNICCDVLAVVAALNPAFREHGLVDTPYFPCQDRLLFLHDEDVLHSGFAGALISDILQIA